MQLHTHGLQLVARFLGDSSYLEDLDLSWNNLIPTDFKYFLEVLTNNRTLRVLNLSCNMLVDKRDQNNEFDFNFQTAMDEYVKERRQAISMGLGYIMRAAERKTEDEDNLCLKMIFCFRQLIRYNRRIQSL